MPEFAGSAIALRFVNPAGTLNMGPDTRQFSLAPHAELHDITGSSDAVQYSVLSFVTYAPDWSGVSQNAAAGTAYAQQLKPGVAGTLLYHPAGDAAGTVLYTIPAYVVDVATTSPYADVTTYDCAFALATGGSVTVSGVTFVGDGMLLEDGISDWLFEDADHIAWG